MLLLTTEILPPYYGIVEMHSMVQITKDVEVSNESFRKGVFATNKGEYQEAMDLLAQSAPSGANAIIGIKVASSIQKFPNGTFLHLTYIGTPITYEEI